MTYESILEQLPVEQTLEPGEFRVRSRRDGDRHTISLAGELDLASAGDVERELLSAEAGDACSILIDLRAVTFIDSSAIRLLVLANARSRADSDRLVLRSPSDCVLRALRICGVDELLAFDS